MNAAGGGTNKPRDNRGIQGFSNGGLVGGTAGNPPNAKKRKIFFHWTGGFHNQNVGPYHQVFDGSGKPMRTHHMVLIIMMAQVDIMVIQWQLLLLQWVIRNDTKIL